jgi:menaquinone-dependent protoporphyrinogen IX oxidase
MGRLQGEIPRFVKRHRRALSNMPVAYFVVCLTMAEDTPENRQATLAYLEPLRKAAPDVEPVDIGLFAGAVLNDTVEFKRMFFLFKSIVRAVAEDLEDHRDWEAIRAWAGGLRPALSGEHRDHPVAHSTHRVGIAAGGDPVQPPGAAGGSGSPGIHGRDS